MRRFLLLVALLFLPVIARAQPVIWQGSSFDRNQLIEKSAPAGSPPIITVGGQGSDQNVSLTLAPKGNGSININNANLVNPNISGLNSMTVGLAANNWPQPNSTPLQGEGWFLPSLDYSQLATSWRNQIVATTLQPSANTSNIWENNNSFLRLFGPGIAQAELNVQHSYFETEAGATAAGSVEDYEASMLNNGSLNVFIDYLALMNNGTTGTSTGAWFGTKYQLTQQNTTSGALAQYYAIDNQSMAGGGSVPTFYGFIRNADPSGDIVSLGSITLGTLVADNGQLLEIVGPDSSSSTYPVKVVNSSGVNALLINDAGTVIPNALSLGTTGAGGLLNIQGSDNNPLTFPFQEKNSSGQNMLLVSNAGTLIVNGTNLITSTAYGSVDMVVQGADSLDTTYPFLVKNSSLNNMFAVNDTGGVIVNGVNIFNSDVAYGGVQMLLQGPDTSGSTPIFKLQNSAPSLLMFVTDSGDTVLSSGSALATNTTAGFVHLPFTSGTPTGTPVNVNGDACLFNTTSDTLNCYIGGGWFHVTLSSGAG